MRQSEWRALRPTMRRNLSRLYRRATFTDVHEGTAWYATATDACNVWADRFDVDRRTIACVIAAISPQCDWSTNLRIALELLHGQTVVSGGALRANVDKARRVLADRATSLDAYFKDGPKVCAFATNLMGDGRAVTVDTHAVQAALNRPTYFAGLKTPAYRIVADVYRDVADRFGVTPREFQATIWCIWKHRYSPVRKRAIQRVERINRQRRAA